MPDLRRGRILQFVMPANSKWPGVVFPAIVVKVVQQVADDDTVAPVAALSVFTDDGAVYTDGVPVSPAGSSPQRGAAFWPDLTPGAVDVDFVPVEDQPAQVVPEEVESIEQELTQEKAQDTAAAATVPPAESTPTPIESTPTDSTTAQSQPDETEEPAR